MHPKIDENQANKAISIKDMNKNELVQYINELESRIKRVELFVGLSPTLRNHLDKTGRYR